MDRDKNDPIVISGISGRFPESKNLDEFWSHLMSGQELYKEDDSRWTIGKFWKNITIPV